MILSELLQYDLSGEKVGFKRVDMRFAVFTNNQVLHLKEPAYANSIVIYKTDEHFNKEATPLKPGAGYSISGAYEAACRDFESESHARVLYASYPYYKTDDTVAVEGKQYYKFNPANESFYLDTTLVAGDTLTSNTYYEKVTAGWNAKLVNKIQMTISGSPTAPTYVVVTYQAYRNSLCDIYGDGEGPLYSPGLMRTVIERINELERNRASNIVSGSQAFSSCLEIDLTGTKNENFVKKEKHLIDTTADKFVVRPINGSFYKYSGDDLKVEFVSLDGAITKTLVPETGDGSGDYEVVGLNYAKTAMSEPTGGVYEFIAIKKALVGHVFLDYHAFGGEVSVADITQIKDDLVSVMHMLDNTGLLTTDNLPKSVVIANMLDRLDFLEHQLQHYRTQTFLYETANDKNKWVNIAYINSHPWMDSAPIPDHEIGKFQFVIQQFNTATSSIQTEPGADPMTRSSVDLEFKFSYEPVRNSNKEIVGIALKTKEVHMSHVSFETEGVSYFYKRFTPKFRVISGAKKIGETTPSFNNGVVVQMALTSQIPTKCLVVVSDKTAAKSPWTLIDSLNNERPDESDFCQFNGATWSSEEGIVSNTVPVYGNGYSVFRGSLKMTEFNSEYTRGSFLYGDEAISSQTTDLDICGLSPDIQLDAIKKIRIRVFDRHTCGYIETETSEIQQQRDLTSDDPSKVSGIIGSVMYYLEDMCGLSIQISKPQNSAGTLKLVGYSGSNSAECDRFYLTGIDIL